MSDSFDKGGRVRVPYWATILKFIGVVFHFCWWRVWLEVWPDIAYNGKANLEAVVVIHQLDIRTCTVQNCLESFPVSMILWTPSGKKSTEMTPGSKYTWSPEIKSWWDSEVQQRNRQDSSNAGWKRHSISGGWTISRRTKVWQLAAFWMDYNSETVCFFVVV